MIHCLSIPTPFAVGRVNCYLIEDDPLTLVDTGPNSGKALDELDIALREHGHRIDHLERIVITHQHLDHMGLAGILARRSNAEVVTLDLLAPVLEEFGAHAERDDELAESLMLRHGIPRDVVIALRSMSRAFRAWGGSAQVDRQLADGEYAGVRRPHPAGAAPARAIRRPTPCSGTPSGSELIGGDHLIGHISSNPLISRPLGGKSGEPGAGRPRALMTYMARCARRARCRSRPCCPAMASR